MVPTLETWHIKIWDHYVMAKHTLIQKLGGKYPTFNLSMVFDIRVFGSTEKKFQEISITDMCNLY